MARRQAYLIRIPCEADQERALVSFRGIGKAVHCVEEDEFLVTKKHLEALRRAGIPFEDTTNPLGRWVSSSLRPPRTP
jgi:hypothetical protein